MSQPEPVDLAVAAARAADSKGATDLVVLDVEGVLGICSHFVVASASISVTDEPSTCEGEM